MRDFLADLFARLGATNRQQRLYLALGLAGVLVIGRYGLGWFLEYRTTVKDDIQFSAQRLANARRLVARAPQEEGRLSALQQRYRQTVSGLIPGSSPTLAAAELQDRVSNVAAQTNVLIQTTQVLKDEPLGPFRQVSLRVTASGELRDLAAFLSSLEFGDLRISIPFLELSRRGVAIRRRSEGGGREGRAVSATIQITGILQGSAEKLDEAAPPVAAPVSAPGGPPDAPPGAAAPSDAVFQSAPVPEPPLDRPPVPEDPLGTAGQLAPEN